MSFAELSFSPKQLAEIVAATLSILSVALLSRGDGRGWPLGTLTVVVSGYVYWLENIQGQALLNVYFFLAQLIGWRRWAAGREPDMRRTARKLSARNRALVSLAWLAATAVVAAILKKGGSAFVELDAFTTVGSLIAQALIVAGFAEAWLVYLAVDVVLIALSAKAGLWYYLTMYCIFCVLAWQGWRGWTRDSGPQKRTDAAEL